MSEQQPVEPYQTFLQTKQVRVQPVGMEIALTDLHSRLFSFQRALVQWALRKGRAALFCDCGTGKTGMQLEWARLVHQHSGGDVLILAPLAVASQTIAEGKKLDIPVQMCRSQADVRPGLNITNYEMLSHFDPNHFCGVVLDESGILKSFMGKTKRALVEAFQSTPYRLCCTATPAPNDVMEIGNHSEFLGVMPSSEMLMRFFINDTMRNGHYRLKGHAEKDFWQWVASWAISLRKPSDLGYSDEGFVLPALQMTRHYVETDVTVGVEDGQLFRAPAMSAINLHKEMRLTAADRAQAVADLVNASDDTWVVWCNTNYEADELVKHIPDAIEVRGSDSITEKERKLTAFSQGKERVIISKASISGYGLNWQHCHKTAFVGLSYCYDEATEVLTRRGWLSFGDVVLNDDIATINQETLALEWQQPTDIIWQFYDGPMVRFDQKNINLLVTPNHKLFVERNQTRHSASSAGWHLREAGDIVGRYRRQEWQMLTVPSSYQGNHPDEISVPVLASQRLSSRSRLVEKVRPETFMRLAGWYLSEGNCRKSERYGLAGIITITQTDKHPENRTEIIAMLGELGLSVNSQTKDITACSLNLARFLVGQFGSGSGEKHVSFQ